MSKEIKSIKVLGSGCPTCKQMFETTKNLAGILYPGVVVEYVTDVTKIIELGVMSSPVLLIDGRVALAGKGYGEDEIKQALTEDKSAEDSEGSACGCSCNCC